jgi:hypothetical protein
MHVLALRPPRGVAPPAPQHCRLAPALPARAAQQPRRAATRRAAAATLAEGGGPPASDDAVRARYVARIAKHPAAEPLAPPLTPR